MAMTKAEKAEFEAVRLECARHKVLRYHDRAPARLTRAELEALPRVDIPCSGRDGSRQAAVVWFANTYNGRVSKGHTDGTSHCIDVAYTGSWSQGAGGGFGTERDAWDYVRHCVSQRAADDLIAIQKGAGCS